MMEKTILLIGGTSETKAIAETLAKNGFRVLVSTATDLPLNIGDHPLIRRRCGRLTGKEFENLIQQENIFLVVNAAHPYAVEVHKTTLVAAKHLHVPHIDFIRPESIFETSGENILFADSHLHAAKLAADLGRRILLTIGVNNINPYIDAARAAGKKIIARILPADDSTLICKNAGLSDEEIVYACGVQNAEENERLIRRFGIDLLVTKDSGVVGGVPEKLLAARRTNCRVIVVRRPAYRSGLYVETLDNLIAAVRRLA